MTSAEEASSLDVVSVIADYLAERAEAGLAIAKSVESISLEDRVLTVVFHPEAQGFEAWATVPAGVSIPQFVGTPIAFDNELGRSVRPQVDVIRARFADGDDLGSMTIAELQAAATGRGD